MMAAAGLRLSTWWSSDMRRLILVLCIILAASSVYSYDFPAPGGRITSSFGSKLKGQFNTGIDVETENVFASEEGEVLYLGNDSVAIAHRDSILTVYSNIAVSKALSKDVQVRKGQLLGSTKGGVLHFSVYDLEMERYINPVLMTEDIKKSELPEVKGLSYDESQGLLSVRIADKGLLGLYKVQIHAGGEVVSSLDFRTIKLEGDILRLGGRGFSYDVLYGREGVLSFPDIHLNQGINNIDVIITDFYGKKVEFHGRITI